MKKLTALMLALLLCVSVACAWSCPTCASSMEGNFCSECGTKKPDKLCYNCGIDYIDTEYSYCTECGTKLGPDAAPQENKGPNVLMYQQEDGRAALLWDGDATAEYTVEYFPKHHDTAAEDLTATTALDKVSAKTAVGLYVCSRMIPGQDYWVGVFDAQGNGEYAPYVPAKPVENFTSFETTVQTTEVIKINGEDTYPAALDAGTLLATGKGAHGLYVVLLYNNPGAALEDAVIQMVITTPTGYRYMAAASKATIAANTEDGIGWRFYDFYNDAALLTEKLGTLPLGDYQISMYVNGQLAGNAAFQVE